MTTELALVFVLGLTRINLPVVVVGCPCGNTRETGVSRHGAGVASSINISHLISGGGAQHDIAGDISTQVMRPPYSV